MIADIKTEVLTYEKPKRRAIKLGTKKGFRDFLEANKTREFQAMVSTRCPLAEYFSSVNGFRVSVGNNHCSGWNGDWKALGKWHTAFVHGLDMGSIANSSGDFIVTGEQALEVLDSL